MNDYRGECIQSSGIRRDYLAEVKSTEFIVPFIQLFSAIFPYLLPVIYSFTETPPRIYLLCPGAVLSFWRSPDSSLLVKHAYISDGFKPAAGRRSAGRIFLNYERSVVESCIRAGVHAGRGS